ncbi:hypothetical protein MUK42_13890 [Musa troglodytarum]|uniref:Uncharacterized protein n=1 Tax=Musa troglodytarum TaxID=320322 RepID=A0A9E7H1D8_9LILI|nr:hypothetical protein MUK42_13890 [Musa troglodytarum]
MEPPNEFCLSLKTPPHHSLRQKPWNKLGPMTPPVAHPAAISFPPHTSFLRLLSSPSLPERPSASRSSPAKGDREAGRRSSQSPGLHPSLP